MKYLKSYKLFESLDFNDLEESDISSDVKYILMDAKDLGYTIDVRLTTNYRRSFSNIVDFHNLELRFQKKVVSYVSQPIRLDDWDEDTPPPREGDEKMINIEFNTNELKDIDDRLTNYFGYHLLSSYYNDLVEEQSPFRGEGKRKVFRLSPNPGGSPGHKFPENLVTTGLIIRYHIDKDIH